MERHIATVDTRDRLQASGRCTLRRATLCLVIGALFFSSVSAMGLPPLKRFRQIQDEAGQRVSHVCVIPLYLRLSGLSVGPDGAGRKISEDAYLLRPFRFLDGENFPEQILRNETRLVPAVPYVAFGDTWVVTRFLLARPGYEPRLLDGHEAYGRGPLLLKRDAEWRADGLLEALTGKGEDDGRLRAYFKPESSVRSIRIQYVSDDWHLLRSCLDGPRGEDRTDRELDGKRQPGS